MLITGSKMALTCAIKQIFTKHTIPLML
jgi:hypothetical protein